MKIGIVSDSHGSTGALDAMLTHPAADGVSCWLFAGDIAGDAEYLSMVTRQRVVRVAGNNDWPSSSLQDVEIAEIGGHRIFLTHGHLFGVSFSTAALQEAARAEGADLAVYGHTHVADCSSGEITVLNPGSIARPRDSARGSFLIVSLLPDQQPECRLIRLSKAKISAFSGGR